MTLAARNVGIAIIPTGKCNFPIRMIKNYKPSGIAGSIFKLLHLAKQMKLESYPPEMSSIKRLVVGGEAFADESRSYLEEIWGCDVFNTYGSTEGTMCGECKAVAGLHVPEDLVHMDLYDSRMKHFVKDGECGRIVLTTLLPVKGRCGTLLINYDIEDMTTIVSRDQCPCGRTHMRIFNPQREAETVWVTGYPFNRVDIERGVFQRENMEYFTGEYEAFLYSGDDRETVVMRLSVECEHPDQCNSDLIMENFLRGFLSGKPGLRRAYNEGVFKILLTAFHLGELELNKAPGRRKRLVDRR